MKLTFLLLVFSFILVPSFAQNKIDFTDFDLKNGLHVILHEDHSSPIVAVTVMYHVGSKNEDSIRTGMAHFFEHLLFEGSKNIGRGEFTRYVENAGGILNANTSNDRTFFYEVLPSNQFELGLWLESERMMHATIDSIGIATQREVVKEEKRQSYDNAPYGKLIPEIMKTAFLVHPYRWTTIGSLAHLDAATKKDFVSFYEKFYVPNNAVLSIAGDMDSKAVKKLIQRYFKDIPKGKELILQPALVEPVQNHERRDTIFGNDQLPLVVFAFHTPPMTSEDSYALSMITTLLSEGESSRLNTSLVENQQLAMYSGSFFYNLEDAGLTMFYAVANVGVTPQELENAMNVEIEKIKSSPISDSELEKLRNQMESTFYTANAKMAGIAENLANYYLFYGDSDRINTDLNRYLQVTKEDLMHVAQKYLTTQNRTTLYYLPKQDQ